MVISFKNQEKAYENWCEQNIKGFVFNNAGGKTGNVLHLVGCRHLTVPTRKGTYTTRYIKYCSDNLEAITFNADEISKPYSWRHCKACFKN
ncbi:hypothetical protein ACFVRR_17735 [Gottfriedia sp. NPDC057948]|uniref:hypothetical protein n=1 Tax=Gottfriedia sp. NPDC057948 TaxID=3346287 RepID=UPI0036D83716